jgi:hypothetical protein
MTRNLLPALLVLFSLHTSAPIFCQLVTEMKKVTGNKRPVLDSNGWKDTGFLLLNVNQAAQNGWGSGGENFQIGINFIFNKDIHHKKGKYTFDAYIDLELGLMESSSIGEFRKTSDRCDITVELDHSIGTKGHFNYGFLSNFNSQLFRGRDYYLDGHPKISSWLTPGKFLISAGVDYKDSDSAHYFSAFVSPATIRWVVKRDPDFYDKSKFGVDSAHKVYTEVGAYFSAHYNVHISKTVNYIGRLDLFSNYLKKPGKVDVFMTNLFTFNISKRFAGSILFDLLYDADIKNRLQIQEITGIGLRLSW